MARPTRSKPTSKPPITPGDNPNSSATPPSETPAPASRSATPSTGSLQETITLVQATASNTAKKTKANSKAPKDSDNMAVLVAKLAEREGKFFSEIDKLVKASQSMGQDMKPKEISRPDGTIANLQRAMGLEKDRALYMNCRATISDVLAHAGIPLDVDWRRQDAIALGKVASVARSRNIQLQLYEKNWAVLEIMKTIIKNKRNYRSKIGRPGNYNNQDLPDQTHSSGSRSDLQQAGGTSTSANDGGFSNSDSDERGAGGDGKEAGTSSGSAGMKRKATGSSGKGGKGKQRKV